MCEGRTKCCFCCSLRDGSIVIASFGIAFGVFSSFVHITVLIFLHYYECDEEKLQLSRFAENLCKNLDRFITIFGLLLAWALLKILFSILLIFGVNKRVKKYVIPWLVVQGISVVFLLFVNMWALFEQIQLPYIGDTGFTVLVFIVNLFEAYLLVIVGYYFCQLTKEQGSSLKPETNPGKRPDASNHPNQPLNNRPNGVTEPDPEAGTVLQN